MRSALVVDEAGVGEGAVSSFLGGIMLGPRAAAPKVASGPVTDVYVPSGRPVAVRMGSGSWVRAVRHDGSAWVFDGREVRAFINGIYTGEERDPEAAHWIEALRRFGSLHPATVIGMRDASGQMQLARVRCTIQRQSMGAEIGLVVRLLSNQALDVQALGFGADMEQRVLSLSHGLVVVTGPTGAGKSTTIAALLQAINRERTSHILTIEDPIEYEFEPGKSVVTQREIGVDVPSFAQGVKDALRFVPDVIMVGEIRDEETMRAVVRAAESGHLVMTSMHAPTVSGAILKMRALLQAEADIWALANVLQIVIAQGLIKSDLQDDNVLLYEILPCQDRQVQQFVLGARAEEWQAVRARLDGRQMQPPAYAWGERLRRLVRERRISERLADGLRRD